MNTEKSIVKNLSLYYFEALLALILMMPHVLHGIEIKAHLESPFEGSFESGIGLIRGWVCNATRVEVQIDNGQRQLAGYGTKRRDTASICGDTDNGFGLTYNWNTLSTGIHKLEAFADDVLFASVRFKVTTLGSNYLTGISANYTTNLYTGRMTLPIIVHWSEPHQNFVIVRRSAQSSSQSSSRANLIDASLESPFDGSFESGIGLIRGWACNANKVEIQIDGGERLLTAYGTTRKDTAEVCGDINNGFGLTYNWNQLGDGSHNLRAYIDGIEFSNVNFLVSTLGEDYLQIDFMGDLPDFPYAGNITTIQWSTPHQNFVITKLQGNSTQPSEGSRIWVQIKYMGEAWYNLKIGGIYQVPTGKMLLLNASGEGFYIEPYGCITLHGTGPYYYSAWAINQVSSTQPTNYSICSHAGTDALGHERCINAWYEVNLPPGFIPVTYVAGCSTYQQFPNF